MSATVAYLSQVPQFPLPQGTNLHPGPPPSPTAGKPFPAPGRGPHSLRVCQNLFTRASNASSALVIKS